MSQEVRAAEPPGRGTWAAQRPRRAGAVPDAAPLLSKACSAPWPAGNPSEAPPCAGGQRVIRQGSRAAATVLGLDFRGGDFRAGGFGGQPRFCNVCALRGGLPVWHQVPCERREQWARAPGLISSVKAGGQLSLRLCAWLGPQRHCPASGAPARTLATSGAPQASWCIRGLDSEDRSQTCDSGHMGGPR